jgi:hypothetical protein
MCHLTPTVRFLQQAIPNGCSAKALKPCQRLKIGVQALAGCQPITALADRLDVSRKFIYQQRHKAQEALNRAFSPDAWANADDEVLFSVPVTKAWLKQLVLALTLINHSSFRGVVELLRDLFDCRISVGTVHNIVQAAVARARQCNTQQDLANVDIGAHDEIFQARQPVLVGADVASTYCYLLSLEKQRDAVTWGVRLLELQERGLHPQATIADFGTALRAGQELAMPGVLCRGDLFHLLQELEPLVGFLENRAYDAMEARSRLEQKQASKQRRHGRSDPGLSQQLRHARPVEDQALNLAADVALLVKWLRADVLAVAGPDAAGRRELYDFIVAELHQRIPQCRHRLEPVCRLLANRREEMLAFAVSLDQDLAALAQSFEVSATLVRQFFHRQLLDANKPQRWQDENFFRQRLGTRYYPLRQALKHLARTTVRASSVIENLNSRLRNYFFLRRHLGNDHLALLQFFLNHRRFLRSEHAERAGKSPAELLTGQPHPHWLEMLGYSRFSRN